jgi:hypothetical protein
VQLGLSVSCDQGITIQQSMYGTAYIAYSLAVDKFYFRYTFF